MNPTGHTAGSASTPGIGPFATLRALLHAKGSGAPSRTLLAIPLITLAAPLVLASTLALLAGAPALTLLPGVAQAESCPNAQFRTGPSAHLPDCRAYEQVSPPVKDAAGVRLNQLGSGGSSALLEVFAAVGGLEGFPDAGVLGPVGFYSTQRTASGWSLLPDDPPSSEYLSIGYGGIYDLAGVSEDGLSTVWLERGVSRPETSLDLYARRPDRSIVDVGPGLPPSAPPKPPISLGRSAELAGSAVSADGSHVLFTLGHYFWPGDNTLETPAGSSGNGGLYEFVGTGNTTPLLVGVSDGKTVVAGENEDKPLPAGEVLGRCGSQLAGETTQTGMSASGNVVVFRVLPSSFCGSSSAPPVPELFARVDNGLPDAHTTAISEPSKEDCAACDTETGVLAESIFIGVSEDGSKVFFETKQPLLGGDASNNIYEYDFAAPAGQRIVRVSGGDSTVSNPTAEVADREVAFFSHWLSEDGSRVYFIAKGVLTTTPNGQGESAEAGAYNLYMVERDRSFPAGRTAFVARLSLSDLGGESSYLDVTPDGRFAVFSSARDLTPDDTSTARQVFKYDAQTGALTRISIGQDGFDNNGNAALSNARIPSPGGTGYTSQYWTRSAVSADGSYVFFESAAGLTPQAFNEKVIGEDTFNKTPIYAQNVYEYHAGRVSLISDGRDIGQFHVSGGSGSAVELLGTDASGADVFFRTADPLVGQDTDTDIDIYDARVAGGFPAPVVPSPCSGEECQGALSGAPTLLSPGSQFQAGGNPPLAEPAPAAGKPKPKAKPKKCKKSKTLKHNKCVKAKAKKASHNRRAAR